MPVDRSAVAWCQLRVAELCAAAHVLEAERRADLDLIPARFRPGATNLVHYLALRRHDIRPLQRRLATLGLSSLGRVESHVLPGLEAVATALDALAPPREGRRSGVSAPDQGVEAGAEMTSGDALLATHTQQLLGEAAPGRTTRIMVTLPTEAADDAELVRALIGEQADLARINCAHDRPKVWKAMARHVRQAAEARGRPCRVLMDLGGPKLRTSRVVPGPRVLRVKVRRDDRGRRRLPRRVVLYGQPARKAPVYWPPPPHIRALAGAWVPTTPAFVAALRPGDTVVLADARGRERRLAVVERCEGAVVVEAARSMYLEPRLALRQMRDGVKLATGAVGQLPTKRTPIVLAPGDLLLLGGPHWQGRNARRDKRGRLVAPARIGCTLPEVLAALRPGDPVLFDDGKLAAAVERVDGCEQGRERGAGERRHHPRGPCAALRIVRGGKLRADKGINVPETPVVVSALSSRDLRALDVVMRHADLVGLSFVREVADVVALHDAIAARAELRRRSKRSAPLGIILKIETRRGFDNLPELMLAGLQRAATGVMVARGDLGVEVGYQRMAELQEEILWLCEAAHVPVIWATQVLQQLTKTGTPTRGEVTDAAMSGRAECVMLNKGPFVADSVGFLDDVLRRMERHRHKKTALLRRLAVSAAGRE